MTKRQFFSSLSESCRCCCWCCCCCCCKLCCCKCCCCCYCCCQRWRGWRRFCLPRSTSWIFILTHSSIPPESVSLQKATIFSIKFFWRAPLTSYFCFYLFFNSSVTGSQKRNETKQQKPLRQMLSRLRSKTFKNILSYLFHPPTHSGLSDLKMVQFSASFVLIFVFFKQFSE